VRTEKNNIFYGVDWTLVILYSLLVGFGWVNIYAASITDDNTKILDISTRYGKQLVWMVLCIPLIVFILFFNSKFYEKFASIFYFISILSLIGLFLFGKNINGATSWYSFGSMSLQPSEFAKTFTALAVAKLLSEKKYNLKLIKNQIKAFVIIFHQHFLLRYNQIWVPF
jgi:rod shape determining protein RodA